MININTTRLYLREFTTADAPFIIELLNDPSFIKNIADRGVRTIEDAENYIVNGPAASYEKNGFGLWCVMHKEDNKPAGMCGLINRPSLEDIDLGYAFLPAYRGKGYALEAAEASLNYGLNNLALKRIVAVVNPDNEPSIRLLEKLNFVFEKMVRLSADDIEVKLFGFNV